MHCMVTKYNQSMCKIFTLSYSELILNHIWKGEQISERYVCLNVSLDCQARSAYWLVVISALQIYLMDVKLLSIKECYV